MANQHSRLDDLKRIGMEIIQHFFRVQAETTGNKDAIAALDVTPADGFYEIRQKSRGGVDEAATISLNSLGMPVPVVMKPPNAALSSSVSTCESTVFHTGLTHFEVGPVVAHPPALRLGLRLCQK